MLVCYDSWLAYFVGRVHREVCEGLLHCICGQYVGRLADSVRFRGQMLATAYPATVYLCVRVCSTCIYLELISSKVSVALLLQFSCTQPAFRERGEKNVQLNSWRLWLFSILLTGVPTLPSHCLIDVPMESNYFFISSSPSSHFPIVPVQVVLPLRVKCKVLCKLLRSALEVENIYIQPRTSVIIILQGVFLSFAYSIHVFYRN